MGFFYLGSILAHPESQLVLNDRPKLKKIYIFFFSLCSEHLDLSWVHMSL